MNIYTGLLFQHGYIQDPRLALSLAGQEPAEVAAPAAERRPVSAEPKTRQHQCREAFRRGGIASACSVALSLFR